MFNEFIGDMVGDLVQDKLKEKTLDEDATVPQKVANEAWTLGVATVISMCSAAALKLIHKGRVILTEKACGLDVIGGEEIH